MLINPPSYDVGEFASIIFPRFPWELACLAAVLEESNIKVEILDCNFIKGIPELISRLKNRSFKVVGITAMTPYIKNAYILSRAIKKINNKTIIVLGGWHASALPERTLLECPEIDIIVRGEGELTFLEIVKAIEKDNYHVPALKKIKGITFRSEYGKIIGTEDRPLIKNLDDLPFPARHLLPLDRYPKHWSSPGAVLRRDETITYLQTSRGCPYQCRYCCDHLIFKRNYRYRSIDNVIEEIKHAKENHGMNAFAIIDANFLQIPRRVEEFCRKIIKEKLDIRGVAKGR
ncbi:MAG: B12-binding domain-containing radical SAM protein [Promethearchaeota archaeon]